MSNQKPDADELDLSRYRWQNRVLLVFAPTATDPRLRRQSAHFAGQPEGFEERELLTFYLTERADDRAEIEALSGAAAARVRRDYAIADGAFAVLLIGKDGGLKERFTHPVDSQEIFALIDVMPMRRREMQERSNE